MQGPMDLKSLGIAWLALAATLGGCTTTAAAPASVIAAANWTSIYRDGFGASSGPGCATAGTCHGAATQTGVVVSKFSCANADDCYASVVGDSRLVLPADKDNPSGSLLIRELRQTNGKGRMPLGSSFAFQPEDIALIEAWIASGAPKN